MKKVLIALSMATTVFVTSVDAANIRLGSGGPTGSYFAMANDIATYCGEELTQDTLEIFNTNGSVENLLGLGKKKYSMAIVQEDVLNFHAKRAPKKVNQKRIKVVTPMHVEPMHLLIPKGYKPKGKKSSNMFANFFASDDGPVKVDINLLKGQVVSAWGGSIVSAQALSFFFKLNIDVVKINNGDQVATPIIVVAGYPSTAVENYLSSGKYHLVSIDFRKVSQTADFYTEEFLNYEVDGRVQNIGTIGVQALLVGKSFRNKKKNLGAMELATCIVNNLADMADDSDTSPNWSSVYEYVEDDGQVDWDYFPLLQDKLWDEEED